MEKGGPRILAIESSCDDTSAAVYGNGQILSNIIANQAIHARYGGIVPEVASRMHQENITIVVDAALKQSGTALKDLDAIACTAGPGLLGSLSVGLSFAKALALSLNIPFIAVDHMRAHVLSHFIEEPMPSFPFINLTVSGGHTQLILVRNDDDMELLGQTRDDAAGEAFDKSGKILGLDYPAGPLIDQLANKGEPKFKFPVPQVEGFDFSFSGLKTAILYFIRDETAKDGDFIKKHLPDMCASIQYAIVEILSRKIVAAAEAYDINIIGISGGVAANSGLRSKMKDLQDAKGWAIFFPRMQYCTDNAGMIAKAAYYRYIRNDFSSLDVAPFAS